MITIIPKEPFSFQEILNFLLGIPAEPLFTVTKTSVTRALNIDGEKALFSVNAHKDNLEVSFLTPASQLTQAKIQAFVNEWLDLDRDLVPFYQLAQHDPLLKAAARQHQGLRLVGIPDLFEALSWAIVGQQVNMTFAQAQKRRLAEQYGDCLEYQGQRFLIFPGPEKIAPLEPQELLPLQISRRKGEYLIGVAQTMVDGGLSKEKLLSLPPQEMERALTSLRGIGPWTANYVMMKTLRVQSAFPVDDVGLQNAIGAALGKGKPQREEVLALGQAWSGWEAYATYYLWRTLYGFQK